MGRSSAAPVHDGALDFQRDGGTKAEGWCATIGIGIESNRINGADSFLGLLTDYAGIANRFLFGVGLFDLVGERGFVRAECEFAVS
jgi:hypothetical protein